MSASGTTTVDFGAFPGASDTSVAITGQASIVAGSIVGAWIRPAATADHSADEHWVETLSVVAGNIVAATGFTIYALNVNPVPEPSTLQGRGTVRDGDPGGTRLYGLWTVAWAWS